MSERACSSRRSSTSAAAVLAVPLAQRLGPRVGARLPAGRRRHRPVRPLGCSAPAAQDVMHFAEFGVVMMLFVIGLELQPALLWRLRGPILGLGGLQVTLTTLVVGGRRHGRWACRGSPRARHRHDALALVHGHRAADAEREGPAEDGRRAERVRGAAVPGHRRHPDARHLPAAGERRRRGRSRRVGARARRWSSNLPAWGQTLAVLAAVGLVVGGGRFVLGPVFRQIARTRLREIFTAAALLLVDRHRAADDARSACRPRSAPSSPASCSPTASTATSSRATSIRSRACCSGCSSSPSAPRSTSASSSRSR